MLAPKKKAESAKYFFLVVAVVSLFLFLVFFWPLRSNLKKDCEELSIVAHSVIDFDTQTIRMKNIPETISFTQNWAKENWNLTFTNQTYPFSKPFYVVILSKDFKIIEEHLNDSVILPSFLFSILLSIFLAFGGTIIGTIIISLILVAIDDTWKKRKKK